MQPERYSKIKNLVQTSKVLSETERGEWLELMELMNDKQLLELENILTSPASKGKPLTAVRETPAQPASRASLSHIMNLPGDAHGHSQHPPVHLAPQKPKVPATVPPPSSKPTFQEKLAGMLAEKELPPGKPEFQMELPARTPEKKPAPQVPPVPAKQDQDLSLKSLLKTSRPLETQKPVPHLLVEKKAPSGPPPKPAQPPVKPAGTPLKAVKVEGGVQTSKLPDNAPAKVFDRVIKQQPGEVLSRPSTTPAAAAGKAVQEKTEPAGHLAPYEGTVEQIAPEDLYSSGLENIAEYVRGYMRSYGYHDAIFKLEKSPLYKAYIQTGLSALSGKKPQDKNTILLTREEFEQVADLLGKIRTS